MIDYITQCACFNIRREKGQISDKAYDMNPLKYKNAQVILEAYNQEVLRETVLHVINVLSYNAAWDFKTESDTDTRGIR